jgi:hypothetical protein
MVKQDKNMVKNHGQKNNGQTGSSQKQRAHAWGFNPWFYYMQRLT